jgi:hypothetical protein
LAYREERQRGSCWISDGKRKIVEVLKRGESFKLLVVNMLAAIALMFALTLVGISGSALESDDGASHLFIQFYEWLVAASIAELLLSGVVFGALMYHVASDDSEDVS